jgi:hypothetical protein
MVVAYDNLDMDWPLALFAVPVMIWLGYWLPWFIDTLATYKEQQLRHLRRIKDDPQTESWIRGSAILHIT